MNKNYIKDYIKYKNLYLIEKQKLLIGGGEKEEKKEISEALEDISIELAKVETDLKTQCNPSFISHMMRNGFYTGLITKSSCNAVLPKLSDLIDKLLNTKTKPQIFKVFNKARKNIKDKRENPLLDIYLIMYPKTTSKEKIQNMLGDSDKKNQKIYDIFINASKKQNKQMRGGADFNALGHFAIIVCIWICSLVYTRAWMNRNDVVYDDDVDQSILYEHEDDDFARNDLAKLRAGRGRAGYFV